jgi:hypothetical protein
MACELKLGDFNLILVNLPPDPPYFQVSTVGMCQGPGLDAFDQCPEVTLYVTIVYDDVVVDGTHSIGTIAAVGCPTPIVYVEPWRPTYNVYDGQKYEFEFAWEERGGVIILDKLFQFTFPNQPS